MALLHVDFFSDVLGMCCNMDVILPQLAKNQIGMEGKQGDGQYPTLYLLHGASDDHTVWQRRTSIERYANEKGIAVVMPNAHLSWYTDMYYGSKYWTFISEELIDICRGFFPNMSSLREDTFAAGLSMGGYGALKLGLRTPQKFGAVATLSGSLDIAGICEYQKEKDNPFSPWYQIFGPSAMVKGSDNDLFALAEKLAKSNEKKPDIYMWCGTEDFLHTANIAMRDHLNQLGYNLTYQQSAGDHNWKCWDEKIQAILDWLPIK